MRCPVHLGRTTQPSLLPRDQGHRTIDRRRFLRALVGTLGAFPVPARAQQAGKVYRVGLLANLPPPPVPETTAFLEALRQGLNEADVVEGTNLTIDYRWEQDIRTLRRHAEELVRSQVDVIVSFTTPATQAAVTATRAIPIVFTMVSE